MVFLPKYVFIWVILSQAAQLSIDKNINHVVPQKDTFLGTHYRKDTYWSKLNLNLLLLGYVARALPLSYNHCTFSVLLHLSVPCIKTSSWHELFIESSSCMRACLKLTIRLKSPTVTLDKIIISS